jgi:hypothetical protein
MKVPLIGAPPLPTATKTSYLTRRLCAVLLCTVWASSAEVAEPAEPNIDTINFSCAPETHRAPAFSSCNRYTTIPYRWPALLADVLPLPMLIDHVTPTLAPTWMTTAGQAISPAVVRCNAVDTHHSRCTTLTRVFATRANTISVMHCTNASYGIAGVHRFRRAV